MKATGVVRSVDSLGRIVIPKELRRVMKIREGDPMEIYTETDGEVVLKKYSPVGEMADFAKQFAKALSKSSGMNAVITDTEKVVAYAGKDKDMKDTPISEQLYNLMEERKALKASKGEKNFIPVIDKKEDEKYDYNHEIISPILVDSEVIGSVMLLTDEGKTKVTDAELKMVACGAYFFSLQVG